MSKFQCRKFSPTGTLLTHDYDDCVQNKTKQKEKNSTTHVPDLRVFFSFNLWLLNILAHLVLFKLLIMHSNGVNYKGYKLNPICSAYCFEACQG